MEYAFQNSTVTHIGTIDCSNCKSVQSTFSVCPALKTIEKLIVPESLTYTTTFYNTYTLENITIEGVIGNSLNVQWCTKLTHDSLMSIINALADWRVMTPSSGQTYELTIGETNLAKLTEREIALGEAKGWVIQ